jgi:hypothetical protein
MEIIDSVTIKPFTPLAIIYANGVSLKATKSSKAHLQEESMVIISRIRIDMIYDFSHTNTVNMVHKLVTVFAGFPAT